MIKIQKKVPDTLFLLRQLQASRDVREGKTIIEGHFLKRSLDELQANLHRWLRLYKEEQLHKLVEWEGYSDADTLDSALG